jgi:hypothetical protein
MAHFAQLDQDNRVTTTVVVANDAINDAAFPQSEPLGISLLTEILGPGKTWKQTSYNGKFRGNYAHVGFEYHAEQDLFLPPRPHDNWVIDTATASWQPPVPQPADGKYYQWDQQSGDWQYIPPPPQPFASWTLDQYNVWQPPVALPDQPAPQGSQYFWIEAQQQWQLVEMPTDELPPDKIYVFNAAEKIWKIQDKPQQNPATS